MKFKLLDLFYLHCVSLQKGGRRRYNNNGHNADANHEDVDIMNLDDENTEDDDQAQTEEGSSLRVQQPSPTKNITIRDDSDNDET